MAPEIPPSLRFLMIGNLVISVKWVENDNKNQQNNWLSIVEKKQKYYIHTYILTSSINYLRHFGILLLETK